MLFRDFRCYNGAPNTALRLHMEEQAAIRAKIVALGYTVTWFPVEERYIAFKDYRQASREHHSLAGVLSELSECAKVEA